MDKRCLVKVVISGVMIHIVICVLYVTSDLQTSGWYSPVKGGNDYLENTNTVNRDRTPKQPYIRVEQGTRSNATRFREEASQKWLTEDGASTTTSPLTTTISTTIPTSTGSTTALTQTKFPLIHNPIRTLHDQNHPQYDPAFARNTRPVYLLDWSPSPDSKNYFQPMTDGKTWLYSAYFLECTPPSVRIIAISSRSRTQLGPVECTFLDAKETVIETSAGYMRALKDNHALNYSAAAVECPVQTGVRPYFVSVSKQGTNTPNNNDNYNTSSNMLQVHYTRKRLHNFTVCFSPLHSIYNSSFELIQSIELNRILGASHFVFYNFSISHQVDEILRYYQTKGLASILPWPLPLLETWYYGQIAAINDCIYRNRIISRYVVIVDTDEFIIPYNHSNWLDLINDIVQTPSLRNDLSIDSMVGNRKCTVPDKNQKGEGHNVTTTNQFGSFMFRCSFFAEKPLNAHEKQTLDRHFKLTAEQSRFFSLFSSQVVHYLKRNDFIYEHEKRSKLIVRPETVVSHAIHKTVEHIAGFQTAYVDHQAAFMHHYRPYKTDYTNTLDLSALKFKDELYINLKRTITRFPTIFGPEILANISSRL